MSKVLSKPQCAILLALDRLHKASNEGWFARHTITQVAGFFMRGEEPEIILTRDHFAFVADSYSPSAPYTTYRKLWSALGLIEPNDEKYAQDFVLGQPYADTMVKWCLSSLGEMAVEKINPDTLVYCPEPRP